MRLSLGITGHRDSNAAYRANSAGIETAMRSLIGAIEAVPGDVGKPRLHALLSLALICSPWKSHWNMTGRL